MSLWIIFITTEIARKCRFDANRNEKILASVGTQVIYISENMCGSQRVNKYRSLVHLYAAIIMISKEMMLEKYR